MFDVNEIRQDFPLLAKSNERLIYLDNAATTQKPQAVIDALMRFYTEQNANVHRGTYPQSTEATKLYEAARASVRDFIGAAQSEEIVFTKGVTEALNLVASSFCDVFLKPGGNVIATELEHHSNLLPWQAACWKKQGQLRLVPFTCEDGLDLTAFRDVLDEKTAIVAITGASNSIGIIPPLKEVIRLAHEKGVPVLVDGAQSIQHGRTNVQELDCDFFCFSGHKLYGPMGVGVLYGKSSYMERMAPYQSGGDMIDRLGTAWLDNSYQGLPHRFEAGTPNVADVLGLQAAIHYLQDISLEGIARCERELTAYAREQLGKIPGLCLFGAKQPCVPVISFVAEGMHPFDISTLLGARGIATRCGEHCAQLVMRRLGVESTVRVSLCFYNTRAEIDALCGELEWILGKYGRRAHDAR